MVRYSWKSVTKIMLKNLLMVEILPMVKRRENFLDLKMRTGMFIAERKKKRMPIDKLIPNPINLW